MVTTIYRLILKHNEIYIYATLLSANNFLQQHSFATEDLPHHIDVVGWAETRASFQLTLVQASAIRI
jgi:hypothetical protein